MDSGHNINFISHILYQQDKFASFHNMNEFATSLQRNAQYTQNPTFL